MMVQDLARQFPKHVTYDTAYWRSPQMYETLYGIHVIMIYTLVDIDKQN